MSTLSPSESNPSYSGVEDPKSTGVSWGLGTAFLVWGMTIIFALLGEIAVMGGYTAYVVSSGGPPPTDISQLPYKVWVALIAVTFPVHLLLFGVCWFVASNRGRRSFWQTLGWEWSEKFKLIHAIGLAVAMFIAAFAMEHVLPHKETQLEKLLKLGPEIKYMIAILAVLTAPLVEELVYRGILYSGVERVWGKTGAVITVTLLFTLVHIPQYIQSPAAITAILLLSATLTVLRAWTGKLLPCFVVHLVFNGIQSVALIAFNKA